MAPRSSIEFKHIRTLVMNLLLNFTVDEQRSECAFPRLALSFQCVPQQQKRGEQSARFTKCRQHISAREHKLSVTLRA